MFWGLAIVALIAVLRAVLWENGTVLTLLAAKTCAVQTNYDPMADFYRQAISFLFKQTPAIVLCLCACFVLWNEMNRRDGISRAEMARINSEWGASLNQSREEWRQCEERREALAIRVAEAEIKIRKLIKNK